MPSSRPRDTGREQNRARRNLRPGRRYLRTLGIAALIALEKRRMLIWVSGLGIPCAAAIARPREGADIVENKGANIVI